MGRVDVRGGDDERGMCGGCASLSARNTHNGNIVFLTRCRSGLVRPALIAQNDPVLVQREMKPAYEVHAQDHVVIPGAVRKTGKA